MSGGLPERAPGATPTLGGDAGRSATRAPGAERMMGAERVHWEEGLLLAPQHLQQLDRFHSHALHDRVAALDPTSFGVSSLSFDEDALREDAVRVRSFHGVLPDGLVLRLAATNGTAPEPRAVGSHFGAGTARLDVFLAVRRNDAAEKAASDSRERSTRYRVEHRTLTDATALDQSLDVAMEVPNVHLLFGNEERGGFSTLKVGELVRTEDGKLAWTKDFIAPCVRIGASPYLMEELDRLLQLVSARANVLRGRRRQHHATEALFQSSDITDFLFLQTLLGMQPVLAHWKTWPEVSPQDCFLRLAVFAGQLSPFGVLDPAEFPVFNHLDLRASFLPLVEGICGALDAPSRERCVRLPLESRDDGVHFGKFASGEWPEGARFFLSVESDVEEARTVSELPRLAKISSWSDITAVLSAASPGVPASVSLRPPAEIPARAGRVYFRLDLDNPYWKRAHAENNVAVYLPQPFDPQRTTLELLAVPGHGGRDRAEPLGRSTGSPQGQREQAQTQWRTSKEQDPPSHEGAA